MLVVRNQKILNKDCVIKRTSTLRKKYRSLYRINMERYFALYSVDTKKVFVE